MTDDSRRPDGVTRRRRPAPQKVGRDSRDDYEYRTFDRRIEKRRESGLK
jgi:hypothetical protein